MSESYRPAGYFELVTFEISSYDKSKKIEIKGLIHSFEIMESIKKGSVRGSAQLMEGTSLLREFPLRGEEFIKITYIDFYDVEHTDEFFLYSITDVRPSADSIDGLISYKIHFVSVPKIYTEDQFIRKAYEGLVSDSVKDIFNEYYKDHTEKQLLVQDTEGIQNLIVPNYKPEAAMHFMSRRGYNSQSFSQTFRFFENRKDFIFSTDEYLQNNLYSGSYVFAQNYMVDNTPQEQPQLQQAIVDMEYPMIVNTIDDITSGAYKRKYYAIDMLNNIINTTEYDIRTDFASNNQNMRLFHSNQFIDERITNHSQRWFIQDYSTPGMNSGDGVRMNTYYADIHNAKLAYFYHLSRNKTNITIHGNNNIFAGSTISLDIMAHDSEEGMKEDKQKSGAHLVETIHNVFHEDKYLQRLTLIRNGVGDDGL
jgi:hypothetical protein